MEKFPQKINENKISKTKGFSPIAQVPIAFATDDHSPYVWQVFHNW